MYWCLLTKFRNFHLSSPAIQFTNRPLYALYLLVELYAFVLHFNQGDAIQFHVFNALTFTQICLEKPKYGNYPMTDSSTNYLQVMVASMWILLEMVLIGAVLLYATVSRSLARSDLRATVCLY